MFWVVAARMRVRSRGGGILAGGFWSICLLERVVDFWGVLVVVVMVLFWMLMRGMGGGEVCFGFEAMGGSFRGGVGVKTAGDEHSTPPCFEFFENRPSAVCHVRYC